MKTNALVSKMIVTIMLFGAFAVTNALAQETEDQREVKIKIIQKDGDQTIEIDTSFSIDESTNVDQILKQFNIHEDFGIDELESDEKVEIMIRKLKESDDATGIHIEVGGENHEPDVKKMAFLGVYGKRLSSEKAKELGLEGTYGSYVVKVIENTSAEEAGLKEGDVIIAVNGLIFDESKELIDLIEEFDAGEEVNVSYIRDGKKGKTKAKLGEKTKKKKFFWTYEYPFEKDFLKDLHHDVQQGLNEKVNKKPFLGITIKTEEVEGETKGITVNGIIDNSSAQDLGIEKGDVIKSVNGKQVNNLDELRSALNEISLGSDVEVVYERDGKQKKTKAPIKAKPFGMHYKELGSYLKGMDFEKKVECLKENAVEIEELIEKHGDQIRIKIEQSLEGLDEKLEGLGDYLQDMDNIKDFDIKVFMDDENVFEDSEEHVIKKVAIIIQVDDISEEEISELNKRSNSGLSTRNDLDVESMKFSPNPNNGKFKLSFDLPEKGKTTVKVFDANGKLVWDENLNRFTGLYEREVDITENPKGTYFLQIVQGDKFFNRKIIVQ